LHGERGNDEGGGGDEVIRRNCIWENFKGEEIFVYFKMDDFEFIKNSVSCFAEEKH
jgi:hypothetical protein